MVLYAPTIADASTPVLPAVTVAGTLVAPVVVSSDLLLAPALSVAIGPQSPTAVSGDIVSAPTLSAQVGLIAGTIVSGDTLDVPTLAVALGQQTPTIVSGDSLTIPALAVALTKPAETIVSGDLILIPVSSAGVTLLAPTIGTVVIVTPDPGDVRFGVVYEESSLPDVGDVRLGVSYGEGGAVIGTLVVPAESDVRLAVSYGADGTEYEGTYVGVYPDPAYVHLDAGDYGPTGTEYTPELSLLENWTEIASPASVTDCIPVRIAAAVTQEINLAAAGGMLSKSFTAVFSFGSEITKLEDINDGGLVVDVLPAQSQEWGHVAGGKYRHAVTVKVGIRRRIASTDRTEAGAVDATDVTGYVNLLYEIIALFAAGRNLTSVEDAVWNSGVRPTIQLYDEQQLKSGLYVGWVHLPFLYHEPAGT